GRRSSLEPAVPASIQAQCEAVQIHLYSTPGELRVVPVVGKVFQLVAGTVAAGVQPPAMELGVEEDQLQQREAESQAGMDAKGLHARGTEPLFCRLPGEAECLRSPSSDAERSPM